MAGTKRTLPVINGDAKKPAVDDNEQVCSHCKPQAAMPGNLHTTFLCTPGGAVHLASHCPRSACSAKYNALGPKNRAPASCAKSQPKAPNGPHGPHQVAAKSTEWTALTAWTAWTVFS